MNELDATKGNCRDKLDKSFAFWGTQCEDAAVDFGYAQSCRESYMIDPGEIGETMAAPRPDEVDFERAPPGDASEFYPTKAPLELHMSRAFSEFYQFYSDEELPDLKDNEHYVTRIYAQGMRNTVVQREGNLLDLEEAKKYPNEVQQAMLEELLRWCNLGAFERMPKRLASNVTTVAGFSSGRISTINGAFRHASLFEGSKTFRRRSSPPLPERRAGGGSALSTVSPCRRAGYCSPPT